MRGRTPYAVCLTLKTTPPNLHAGSGVLFCAYKLAFVGANLFAQNHGTDLKRSNKFDEKWTPGSVLSRARRCSFSPAGRVGQNHLR